MQIAVATGLGQLTGGIVAEQRRQGARQRDQPLQVDPGLHSGFHAEIHQVLGADVAGRTGREGAADSLLTSGELGSPALEGLLARFGAVTVPEQTVAFAVVIVLAFLLKAILVLAFRWWTMGFTNQNLIRTSATLLRYYLRADYGLHLTRTVGTLVNNVTGTSSMAYTGVVNASVTFLTEAVTLVAVAVVVGVSKIGRAHV